MTPSILLVYSSFEDLPKLYLIPSDELTYKALLRADGFVVNNNDDDYAIDTQHALQYSSSETLAPYELDTGLPLDLDNVIIINTGFAP